MTLVDSSLMAPSLIIFGLLIALLKWKTSKKKLPPLAKSFLQFHEVLKEMIGSRAPYFVEDLIQKYGNILRLYMPVCDVWYVIADAKLARIFLCGDSSLGIKSADKPMYMYQRFAPVFSRFQPMMIQKTEAQGCEAIRKGLAPAFSQLNLNKRCSLIRIKVDEFCGILNEFVRLEKVVNNFEVWCKKLSLDILAISMFDEDFGILCGNTKEDVAYFASELPFVVKEVGLKQVMNPLRSMMIWEPDVIRQKKASASFITMGKRIIAEHRARVAAAAVNGVPEDNSLLLTRVLSIPHKSEEDRAAEVVSLLFAGHDATSFTLSFVVLDLCKNLSSKLKLQSELDSVIPSCDTPVTVDMVAQLPYLDWAIKESMRLNPALSLGPLRECPQDFEYNGYFFPKGATLMFPFHSLFRPTTLRERASFIPERWMPGDPEQDVLEELFIPFAAGKRVCIGQNLARLELQIAIATLFRRFDFELVGDYEVDYFLQLRPLNASLRVTRRP